MKAGKEASTFTVVVIDDKEECCRRITQKVQGIRMIGQESVRMVVKAVHVGVQRGENTDPKAWTFTSDTLSALSRAAETRPDLLIVDYIYIDDDEASELKRKAIESEVTRAEREARSLAPPDLRAWVENQASIDSRTRDRIVERIFEFDGPFYLHSFTPRGLKIAVGTVRERGNDAAMAFPRVPERSLHVLDTRDLFFADDEFDGSSGDTHHDRAYYAYLLGVLFDEIAQKEACKLALQRSRYLRFKRSAPVLAEVAGIGAGIGLAGSAAGALVFELFRDGYVVGALATLGLCIIVAVPLGWIVANLFESLMRRLLPPE